MAFPIIFNTDFFGLIFIESIGIVDIGSNIIKLSASLVYFFNVASLSLFTIATIISPFFA